MHNTRFLTPPKVSGKTSLNPELMISTKIWIYVESRGPQSRDQGPPGSHKTPTVGSKDGFHYHCEVIPEDIQKAKIYAEICNFPSNKLK